MHSFFDLNPQQRKTLLAGFKHGGLHIPFFVAVFYTSHLNGEHDVNRTRIRYTPSEPFRNWFV